MDDWQRDEGRIDAAIAAALRIPGVHGAGIALRWKNGYRTSERVLCLYVHRKQREDELPPRDRVPPEILGIPTDVVEADVVYRPHVEYANIDPDPAELIPVHDTKDYTQLRGGIRIDGPGRGTLGCIARAMDADNTSKLVALSNEHVLKTEDGTGAKVYQAERCSCCCGRRIGTTLRGLNTKVRKLVDAAPNVPSVDAAIALLDPGIPCLGEIQVGLGEGTTTELVRGVMTHAQLKTQFLQGDVQVKKRGSRTGQTYGIVSSPDLTEAPSTVPESAAFARQVAIDPVYFAPNDEGYFSFSARGDSGSLLLTNAGDLAVALLHGSRNIYPKTGNRKLIIGQSIASPIDAVTLALEIELVTTNTFDQVLTNPASPQADFAPQPAFARSMLARARTDIERTRHGGTYVDVVRRHHTEITRLINANRRVGAVWKRNGGQRLVQLMLDAIARPNVPIPESVGERTIEQAARRIAAILRRFGSTALVRDLDFCERAVPRLCGCTYNQLLGRLRAGEPVLG